MVENSAAASKPDRPLVFASSRSGYWRVLAGELAVAERRARTASDPGASIDRDEH